MIELAPPSVAPAAAEQTAAPQPTFFKAWRGIWLLTWKTQLTWRRLPLGLVSLLALPLLVYITTAPVEAWSEHHSLLGNAVMPVNDFSRRMARAQVQLQPEQYSQLRRIFTEEFARADQNLRQTESAESSPERQAEQVRACYERIRNRARGVLEERQFAQFQLFTRRKVLESEQRIGAPLWGRTAPFYHWLIDFYFFVILPLSCVRACGALIRDELQADTFGFLITRPLSRARLLLLKYLSQTAWLQLTLLVEALLLFAAGSLRQIPELGALLLLFLVAQFLAVLAWSALGTFLGLMTNRYVALAIVYGLIVEMGIGRIPTNINTLSLMRHLKALLAHNPVLQGLYQWTYKGVPLAVGALILATAIFLSLAALLFTFKEYHRTAEMQK